MVSFLELKKTKCFCETSFKHEGLKIKNEACLRDFLQTSSFEVQKRSAFGRLPSKMTCWPGTGPQNFNTFERFFNGCFKSIAPATKKLSRGIRTPVTATRNHPRKVTFPWRESCNPSTDSASEAPNIDVAEHEILALAARKASFRTVFKPTTPANDFATLVHKLLRLPRILQRVEIPAPAARKALWTSKNVPRPECFTDFDFLPRRRGATFRDYNFQKCSDAVNF